MLREQYSFMRKKVSKHVPKNIPMPKNMPKFNLRNVLIGLATLFVARNLLFRSIKSAESKVVHKLKANVGRPRSGVVFPGRVPEGEDVLKTMDGIHAEKRRKREQESALLDPKGGNTAGGGANARVKRAGLEDPNLVANDRIRRGELHVERVNKKLVANADQQTKE
jgi:hypothetical protein